MKKSTYFALALFVFMLVTVLAANAQGGGPPPPPPNPQTPIDGGVFILLVGGMIYGAKKLYNKE